jgi:ABC-type transport system involved in cytochrome c biogenesis permease subunit
MEVIAVEWKLLIPVFWIVVATAVALILNKTTAAYFEQKQSGRQIRLYGSVVIAGVVFFGLWWATPRDLVSVLPKGTIAVKEGELRNALAYVAKVKGALVNVSACASIAPPSECRLELELLGTEVENLEQNLPKPQ